MAAAEEELWPKKSLGFNELARPDDVGRDAEKERDTWNCNTGMAVFSTVHLGLRHSEIVATQRASNHNRSVRAPLKG